jgi:hypothetical protein
MEEIIIIYILKNFDDAVKSTSFRLTEKIFMVDYLYVTYLVKVFSVDENTAMVCLKKIAKNIKLKLFVLNIETVLKDIEEQHYNPSILRPFVKGLIQDVHELKMDVVRSQSYEKAAKLRDIELTLMKQYNIKKEDLNPL